MTPHQIDWIKSLDEKETDGTIQSILFREDLVDLSYEAVLEFLVRALKREKDFLSKQNKELCDKIPEHILRKE